MDATAESAVSCAVYVTRREKKVTMGAAVLKRIPRSSMEDKTQFSLDLYEFMDGEQFSALDVFFMQLGPCKLYLSEDLKEGSGGDARKMCNLLHGKEEQLTVSYVKKTSFTQKKGDTNALLLHLVGMATHSVNNAEHQMPLGFACIDVLATALKLSTSDQEVAGRFTFNLSSIASFMRLDSAAADAVNLLPKPDHPSVFGSLFGVLNRCKTKMGSRLLERWLRQPLIDPVAINQRLDIVEVLLNNTLARAQLCDGPLKSAPDLDAVIAKMQRKSGGAGLAEVYRLYAFTRSLPDLISALETLIQQCRLAGGEETTAQGDGDCGEESNDNDKDKDSGKGEDNETLRTFTSRFIVPLKSISDKFSLFQQLVEHVIDLDQLPDLLISSKHDEELGELAREKNELQRKADRILSEARNNWASFCDVKLESSGVHSYYLRSPRADDERQLRANNSRVKVLSMQKNGVHFTTPELESVSDRCAGIDQEYERVQRGLVEKTVTTAATYLPVAEAASALVAELDVLAAFAQAAALSPASYVRPKILPATAAGGGGVIRLKQARHPCVELMDNVSFIANDYSLTRGESSFQIITGPNMGGKSTYIRGVGSIVTMAQVGSFVPCEEAEISVVDAILARVGAGDAVQKGVSTFMAEMLEASVILQTATCDSLIIVDELGRGTSTFDGFGIAWAISEYLVTKTDCLCLFATHFHELTALSRQHPSVVNKHVSAHTDEEKGQVVMLYNVKEGPCLQSFGIHIAATADFPQSVISEAKRKAAELERVGDDLGTEEGREKQRRVTAALTSFNAMDVEKMADEELKGKVKSLVGPSVTP